MTRSRTLKRGAVPRASRRDEIPLNRPVRVSKRDGPLKNNPRGGAETTERAAESLYRQLWSRLGGRPWTYIMRDIYHEFEWLVQTVFFTIGAAAGHFLPWWALVAAWALYTAGYVSGHLFWGTEWRKGEGRAYSLLAPGRGRGRIRVKGD
jgi:hypothetical protein